MILQRGKLLISYKQAGDAPQPVIMMHGWGTDHTLMRRVFESLQANYRVISIDLRGFGDSIGPDHDYSIESYSKDLEQVVSHLIAEDEPHSKKPVIIGHSMGGVVALDFAARFPDMLSAAAILEAPIIAPDSVIEGLYPVLDGLRSEAYREVVKNFMGFLCGPYIDTKQRDRLLEIGCSTPQQVLISAMENMISYDSRSTAAKVKCPLLYVVTNSTFASIEHFRELCPQLVIGQLVGCGHYFPLEAPEQLNPMLLRFLQTTVARRR